MELTEGMPSFGAVLERAPADTTDHSAVAAEDWETIGGVQDLDPGDLVSQMEDATVHDTVQGIARKAPTIIEISDCTFTLITDPDNPAHLGASSMRQDQIGRVRRPYRIKLMDDAATIAIRAFVSLSWSDDEPYIPA
jgi:hypothetical protein